MTKILSELTKIMSQFEYRKILSQLTTPQIMSALGEIREFKGRQDLYLSSKPAELEALCNVAKIQSVSSSNRIENISTSDNRLRALVKDTTQPINRDEREIAGYRYVLNLIHESHDNIPLTPNIILQLHRDLYRYTDNSFAGNYKDADNTIAERSVDDSFITRFVPTSAAATPSAVRRACEAYQAEITRREYDALLACLVFVFDFVSIHPFNDGNGRLSRLLTLLLLYQNDYIIGKYISIEAEIEATKETYYEALAASSVGWNEGKNDYLPFVTYMLGVIKACYSMLDERIENFSSESSNEQIIRKYFDSLVGSATKRQIMNDNPIMSQKTVERILQKLIAERVIEKIGAARTTAYRKIS